MCGVAGWLGNLKNNERVARNIAQALHHRGPDDHNIKQWPIATLIHTRLKIIDLSPTGAQPMSNEDGTVWVVFNGEIYNHRELRINLEKRGHVFHGHSDTEVIPHLYEEHGAGFASLLRGIYSIAVYDVPSKKLILVRDRFGIKPLFYAATPHMLVFASELNALREIPSIDLAPCEQAISDYAALFYIPAPLTFYRGVRALQPGELLESTVESSSKITCTTKLYNRWSIRPNFDLSFAGAIEQAESLIARAVKSQLESDVPLGSFLSGGVDSSLVSLMAQSAMSDPLRTFNVQFPDQGYDETWAAKCVAKSIGSNHLTLDINDQQADWEYVSNLLLHVGQPFADTSLFAVDCISQLIKKYVSVALSGDGGDEVFGGYDWYWQLQNGMNLRKLPNSIWKAAHLVSLSFSNLGLLAPRVSMLIDTLANADERKMIQALFCWIRESEHAQLVRLRGLLPVSRHFEQQWEHHFPFKMKGLELASALATEVNIRLVLPNDYLYKVDTASMRHSLEVRVPFLDEELFQFGLSLPHVLRTRGHLGKPVSRAILYEKVPKAIVTKPKKGFNVPMDVWLSTKIKERIGLELMSASTPLRGYFSVKVYEPWVSAFVEGRSFQGISRAGLYRRIIMLLSLHLHLSK